MLRKLIRVFIPALLLSLPLYGQTSRVMYFMDLPQQRFLNPAFRPSDSMYVGLPVLTGVGFSIDNNFFTFSDVIMEGRSDSLITFLHPDYDRRQFIRKLKKHNSIDSDFIVQLLGFGITLGRGYLFFDLNTRFSENSSLPRELIELSMLGNEPFAGRYADFSSLGGSMNMYHEAGIGYSMSLGSGLRAGVRGKFLFGIASADFVNRNLGLQVDGPFSGDYSHRFTSDVTTNLSGPLTVVTSTNGEIERFDFSSDEFVNSLLMRNPMNPGVAVDAGITYELNREIQLSAAITDLGLISWHNRVTNLGISNDDFQITGIDVSNVLSGNQSLNDAISELLDTLQNSFAITNASSPFTTVISPALNIGGSYKIRPDLSIGILSHSRYNGRQVHQSVTLSANYHLNNRLSATVGYTAANHRYDNIGAGLAVRAGIFQFYMASDRIPVIWHRITSDEGRSSFIIPANWNTVDFRCGMNLVFGHGKNKRADECDFWYR